MRKLLILSVLALSFASCKKNLKDLDTTVSDPVYATPKADGTCPTGYHWEFMGRALGYQCVKNQ